MIIAIDFDGTCCTHAYPAIGEDIGAIPVLKDLVAAGHQLILHTMRSGPTLSEAVNWISSQGVALWGVNNNRDQYRWSKSPKVYAHLYIDDAALGAPLIKPANARPYIDWQAVRAQLEALDLLAPRVRAA